MKQMEIDCVTCYYYKNCANTNNEGSASAGHFCPRWRSTKPEEKDARNDPNAAWRRGDDCDI